MSRNVKIILIILGSLLTICVVACIGIVVLLPRAISGAVGSTPAQAREVGHQIADYTLPPGYEELMGMNLFFQKMVMIAPKDKRGGMAIMMMQLSTVTGNQEQVRQQMQQAFSNQYQRTSGQFEKVGEETVTIRGQPTVLTILESKSGTSDLRQEIGTFNGKGGLVMLMVMGSPEDWDQDALHQFLQSIR